MPSSPPSSTPPLLRWSWWSVLIIWAIWTALALLSVLGAVITFREIGRPIEWRWLFTWRLADWYTCAIFTPLLIWMARRWPIERGGWTRTVPLWIVVVSLCVILKYALLPPLIRRLLPQSHTPSFREMLSQDFIIESMIFWALIGVIHALLYYYRYREREKEAALLSGQLAEARLEALGAQLHPHFLFNTLQGISTLLHRDPDAADRMLARLSDLLRHTLRRAESQEVSLGDELETLDHYVAIQQVRFQDRLTVEKVIGPGAEEVLVPHFVLQPLVENAIEHGIARRAGAGRITIAAARNNDHLELSVTDDGSGLDHSNDFPVEGIGLGNTRRRLAALYGERATLTLNPAPGGGLRVALLVPLNRPG
jgi:two-component system, LytTR family, sensor kinase